MKLPKSLIIYLIITFPIICFVLISSSSGATISYQGFALDRNDNLYIGANGKICVYNPQGNMLREISPMTSRGYRFTIQNETIWVDIGDYLYTLDPEGNVIDKIEWTDENYSLKPSIRRRRFTTETNTVYIMRSPLLRTKIYRIEGEKRIEVFRMPIYDYIVKLLFYLYGLSMFIVVSTSLYKLRHNSAYANQFRQYKP